MSTSSGKGPEPVPERPSASNLASPAPGTLDSEQRETELRLSQYVAGAEGRTVSLSFTEKGSPACPLYPQKLVTSLFSAHLGGGPTRGTRVQLAALSAPLPFTSCLRFPELLVRQP